MTAPVKRLYVSTRAMDRATGNWESLRGDVVPASDYERLEREYAAARRAFEQQMRIGESLDERLCAALDELDNLKRSWGLLHTENEKLRTDFRCPRPCNGRPEDFTSSQCLEAGECGCMPAGELIRGLRLEVEALRAFANEIVSGAFEGGSFDGGDIQEMGVKHGMLRIEQRDAECGEACTCREYGFPLECYRKTELLRAAVAAKEPKDAN